ncbi:MAG: hypothetical protein J5760_02015, partial [Clostridia bacterium]|nr:hypothetical protein [Clostridia bacterium]
KNILKVVAVILLSVLALVSCSPNKIDTEESDFSAAEPVSAAVTEDNTYGPKEIYELSALDEDFLDQSFVLPCYKNITYEELYKSFAESTACAVGADAHINAVTPEYVLCGCGNFVYDKLSGSFTRSCKDPQCRHKMTAVDGVYGACPYTSIGRCVLCGDTAYVNRISLGYSDVTTEVFAMDFSFTDHYFADLPKNCVVEGENNEGKLVLRKEQYVTYIDDQGVQRSEQGNFELYLYDTATGETELIFAPGSAFFVYRSKTAVYCTMYPEYTVYGFAGDCRTPVYFGKIKYLAFLEHAMCYLDEETGEAYRYDELTGEKTLWAGKDSPLTQIVSSVYSGDKLYFCRRHTAAEIDGMDIIPASDKSYIKSQMERLPVSYSPSIIYSCNLDGSDIKITYYVPNYSLYGYLVVDGVLYTGGTSSGVGMRFALYDMSSGVELRVFCPILEYHYPGEYEYKENWLNAFRW